MPSDDGWSLDHHGYDASRERGEESVSALAGWDRLSFPLCYRGSRLRVTIDHDIVSVALTVGDPVPVSTDGRLAPLTAETPINLARQSLAA